MSGLRLALRRALADPTPLVALAVLVVVTAALAAVVPRVLTATADEALAGALDATTVEAREITATSTNDERIGQLAPLDRQVRRGLGPALQQRLLPPGRGVTTDRYDTLRAVRGELRPTRPKPFAWLQLRHQSGLLDQVSWVDGRAPRLPRGDSATARTPLGERVPVLEVALDRDAARTLGLEVGDRVVLEPLEVPITGDGTVEVLLTGLFEPLDPDDVAWSFAPLVTQPGAEYTLDGQLVAEYAAALVGEDQLAALGRASAVLRYDWHYPIDVSTITAQDAGAVLDEVEASVARGATVAGGDRSVTGRSDTVSVSSGLVEVLREYRSRAAATEALVAMVLTGMLGVALAVLALAGVVLVRRRAGSLALVRARGGSRPAAALSVTAEAAVLVAPAAVAGWAASDLVGGERGAGAAALLAGLVGLWTVVVVLVTTWRVAGGVAGERPAPSRVPWRPLVEVSVALAAVLGVLEVRRRGAGAGVGAGVGAAADPVLAAVPVLVVLAVGLAVLRLLPGLLRGASRWAERRRGLVSFVGLARASRQPLAVSLPLAALLLGLGFAVFASGVVTTVDEGQERAAWRETGADYLVEAGAFEEAEVARVGEVPGVEAVVPALRRDTAKLFDARGTVIEGTAIVVDAAAYAELLQASPGSGVEPGSVRALAEPVGDADPLPALVTTGAADVLERPVGTVDPTASLGRTDVTVTEVVDAFPLDEAAPTVVLDLPSVQERESFPVRPTALLVRGPAGLADALRAAAGASRQDVVVVDRRAALEQRRDSPFVGSTQALFLAGGVAAAAYCVLALALTLVLASRPRARLAATLRMLGASGRTVGRLAVLEVAPLLAVFAVAGAAAGTALVLLLLPGLDLVALTGGAVEPTPLVDAVQVVLVLVALLVLVAVTVLAVSALERRRPAGDPLLADRGDET